MQRDLRADARDILEYAIRAVQPDSAVRAALTGRTFPGRVILIAVGKAAWQMASTAVQTLPGAVTTGLVITKYDHVRGKIPVSYTHLDVYKRQFLYNLEMTNCGNMCYTEHIVNHRTGSV